MKRQSLSGKNKKNRYFNVSSVRNFTQHAKKVIRNDKSSDLLFFLTEFVGNGFIKSSIS